MAKFPIHVSWLDRSRSLFYTCDAVLAPVLAIHSVK